MKTEHLDDMEIDEQAAYWLRVMQDPAPDERVAFWSWIKASPAHVRELILAGKVDHELGSFDRARRIDVEALITQGSVSDASREPEPGHSKEKRHLASRWVTGIAASAALFAVAAVLTLFIADARSTYATKLGEQRLLDLEDGSVIFLNTQSKVRVHYTTQARDVYLGGGQALFRVRHDATRPFRVHTDTAVIQAIGTKFDVRVFPDRTTVAVVEGTVQLLASDESISTGQAQQRPSPTPPKVTAGQSASIEIGGRIDPVKRIDTDAVTAWSRQRLVFKGETLGHIADEFNRYNVVPRLRVEGDQLRQRHFIGVFNAHNPGSLLEYLTQDGSVIFVREGDDIVIRPKDGDTSERPHL